MERLYRHIVVLMFGIAGNAVIAERKDDAYIGCYEYVRGAQFNKTSLRYNTGTVCKNHCFPTYRFAGTQGSFCYCGYNTIGTRVPDKKCIFHCLEGYSKCGGPFRLSMYEYTEVSTKTNEMTSTRTTKCSTVTPSTTTPQITNGFNSSDNCSTSTSVTVTEDGSAPFSLVFYISIPVVIVTINICCLVAFATLRRCKKTQPTKRVSLALNSVCDGVQSIEDGQPNPATCCDHTTTDRRHKHLNPNVASIDEESYYNRIKFEPAWNTGKREVTAKRQCNNASIYDNLHH